MIYIPFYAHQITYTMVSDRELIFVRYVANIKYFWRHQGVVTCILRFDYFDLF